MASIHDYLRGMIAEGERGDPRFFVGREEEISRVMAAVANPPPDGPPGTTILIQGAPGAGKTALLAHLRRRVEQDAEAGTLLCGSAPGDDEAPGLYGELASLLIDAPPPTRRGASRRETRIEAGVPAVARGGIATSQEKVPPTFRAAREIGRDRRGGWSPKRRVVFFIDEVQTLKPAGAIARLLLDLHTQAELPVLLVCAGLGSSQSALSAAELSRIGSVIDLGALEGDEALDCAVRSISDVVQRGVTGSNATIKLWAKALAEASDNWPRHLQVYLHAAWSELLGQDHPNLDRADMDAVLSNGHDRRAMYYEARLNASQTPIAVSLALHRRLTDGAALRREAALEVIDAAVEALPSATRARWMDRFHGNSEHCLDALLRAGVVSLDAMNHCASPIPSFSAHILDAAEPTS